MSLNGCCSPTGDGRGSFWWVWEDISLRHLSWGLEDLVLLLLDNVLVTLDGFKTFLVINVDDSANGEGPDVFSKLGGQGVLHDPGRRSVGDPVTGVGGSGSGGQELLRQHGIVGPHRHAHGF